LLKEYNSLNKQMVVIATVPFVDEDSPLAAPAMLKASLEKNGVSCVGLDLNIEIYNKIKNNPNRQKFLAFFYRQIIHNDIVDDLVSMLEFYTQEILSYNPTIIGLSLFSVDSQVFTAWLCAALKQKSPDTKIVIGGPGLETLENSLFKFPDRVKKLGLIDDYITGDADTSLVEYVRGNLSHPGINSWAWKPNDNFNSLPPPDYSNYRFMYYSNALLPIVDSRGCVQNCEFCDVIAFWKKFQYLDAEQIFSRMQMYIDQHRIYRFQFSSSICNGNLREFKKFVKLVSDYNQKSIIDEQIHWVGSFIVRSSNQHPESLWELIKNSNGFLLTGVESVVERVRIGLGKRFTNQDLDHHLAMLDKFQIDTNLLLIATYPTETSEEFEQSKKWFVDHKHLASTVIKQVQLTMPAVLSGTQLEKTIDLDSFNRNSVKRLQKSHELKELIIQCGYNVKSFF
jgi:radical SAM superfamily enzyme YgiQ (UPF0313 family)